jgi:hypothetical protein
LSLEPTASLSRPYWQDGAVNTEPLNWYSALLAFETGIQLRQGGEADEEYSLSMILFQAPEGQAWATVERLGSSDDGALPFVTGWRFAGVLDV